MRNLNKEESEKYIEIVKNGNYDDMADFAYELGVKDGEKYEQTSSAIRESKVY